MQSPQLFALLLFPFFIILLIFQFPSCVSFHSLFVKDIFHQLLNSCCVLERGFKDSSANSGEQCRLKFKLVMIFLRDIVRSTIQDGPLQSQQVRRQPSHGLACTMQNICLSSEKGHTYIAFWIVCLGHEKLFLAILNRSITDQEFRKFLVFIKS